MPADAVSQGVVGWLALSNRCRSSPEKGVQNSSSQAAFAGLMGVSVRTVQDWEQGRRKPSGPAQALLRIAEQRPDVFTQIA